MRVDGTAMRLGLWLTLVTAAGCGARTQLGSPSGRTRTDTAVRSPGDAPVTLGELSGDTFALETDGSWLYGMATTNTWSMSTTGGPLTTLFNFPNTPIAPWQGGVYFDDTTTPNPGGALSWVSHDGSGEHAVLKTWAQFIVPPKVFQLDALTSEVRTISLDDGSTLEAVSLGGALYNLERVALTSRFFHLVKVEASEFVDQRVNFANGERSQC